MEKVLRTEQRVLFMSVSQAPRPRGRRGQEVCDSYSQSPLCSQLLPCQSLPLLDRTFRTLPPEGSTDLNACSLGPSMSPIPEVKTLVQYPTHNLFPSEPSLKPSTQQHTFLITQMEIHFKESLHLKDAPIFNIIEKQDSSRDQQGLIYKTRTTTKIKTK